MALLAISCGWVVASFTISLGNTETGAGAYHPTAALTWWAEASVGVGTQPGVLPTVLSTTVGTPTVLAAAGTNYAINAPTAGDVVHFWKFTEANTAPVNTELELQFTVSTGVVPTVTQITVYIESQAADPATAQTFVLFYDLGSPATGTITLNSVTEIGQQCSAVGTCP
ncbi:MAG TPA: hypothetical protein VEH57_08445 [Thermoplasmata archaeon]|nr:hypothetical protein [Thermoplasmata archaeon]